MGVVKRTHPKTRKRQQLVRQQRKIDQKYLSKTGLRLNIDLLDDMLATSKAFITISQAAKLAEVTLRSLIYYSAKAMVFDTERAAISRYINNDKKAILEYYEQKPLSYVKLPKNHIVIDFDLKDASGNKSMELNLEEASKWPRTYSEFSKSGAGIHLHYINIGGINYEDR